MRISDWSSDVCSSDLRAAEILPVAATGNRCRPNRAPKVEGEDLIVGIAAELHCHQPQQHRLAGAGRPDDQRMADIADMKGKTERGRASGLSITQGGVTEMLVPFRPRPTRCQGGQGGELEHGNSRSGNA